MVGAVRNDSFDYWYLPYNLLLGLLPLGIMLWLKQLQATWPWRSWRVVAVEVAWLLFLPNSFYIVTDFIHLYRVARVDVVQDIAMLMQFSVAGLLAGFISVYIFHRLLLKKMSTTISWIVVNGVFLLSSFAIYLGRELRWNSWDVAVQPAAILADIVYICRQPMPAVSTTLSFFITLASLYLVGWYGIKMVQNSKSGVSW